MRLLQRWPFIIDFIIGLGLFGLALWLRATDLQHFVTADEHNWVYRSGIFLHALLQGDWPSTSVWYTPAVTTTWLGSAGLTVYYYLHQADIDRPFMAWLTAFSRNKIDLEVLLALRWTMALFTAGMVAVVYGLARKLWAWPVALLGALFLLTEPHLLAVSRIIGHDAPLTFFVTASLLAFFIGKRQLIYPPSPPAATPSPDSEGGLFTEKSDNSYTTATRNENLALTPQPPLPVWERGSRASDGGEGEYTLFSGENLRFVLSGVFAGLAILSKAPALVLLPFAGLVALVNVAQNKSRFKVWMVALLIWVAAVCLTFILVWPAAWVDPLGQSWFVISTAFFSSAGLEDADVQPYWSIPDPGIFYYLINGAFKVSPFLMIGAILAAVGLWLKTRQKVLSWRDLLSSELAWLALFAILFGVMMTLGVKRSPRYILPVFPALIFVAAWGWLYCLQRFKAPLVIGILGVLAVLLTLPYAPYYFTYFNPLLGGGPVAARVVRIGWGEGLDEVGRWLNQQPDAPVEQVGARYTVTLYPFFSGSIASPISEELDYVAFYIKQSQSGYPAPEILRYFDTQAPLHRIMLNGIDYAQIYKGPTMQPVEANRAEDLPIAFRPHTIYAPIGDQFTVDLLWPDALSGTRTMGEADSPSFSPHPVASATPLSQFGRGVGGEGLFSGEPVILTLQTADGQLVLKSKASITELAPGVRVSSHSFDIPAEMTRTNFTLSLEGKLLGNIKARFMSVSSDFTPLSVGMAGQLKLAGMRQQIENQQVQLDLAWQAWPKASNDYTVFVQLLDENEQRITGVDIAPERGFTMLDRKEVMLTHYDLPLPDNLEPGQYRLLVGLYYFAGDELINVGASVLESPVVLQ